uniref:Uncharacterized protein n=1 Tax=Romanomermis culicivorax TaxID=13658 RepID=A0A915KPH4_ROMCU
MADSDIPEQLSTTSSLNFGCRHPPPLAGRKLTHEKCIFRSKMPFLEQKSVIMRKFFGAPVRNNAPL